MNLFRNKTSLGPSTGRSGEIAIGQPTFGRQGLRMIWESSEVVNG